MSKKMKFGIIFILIFLIIGLICGIRTIRNFWILNSSINILKENIEKDNYYLKTTLNKKDSKIVTEAYYKEGIGKLVSENGIYTWVDGESAYMVDENNKKIYVMEIVAENSAALVSNEMFVSLIPGYSKNFFEKLLISGDLKNSIKTEKINDEKCYKIKIDEGKTTKTIWINKSRRYPVKGKIEFSNGDVFDYDYDLKFYITKLKNVELPDTSDYTFYEYKTGKQIEKMDLINGNKEITEKNFVTNNTSNTDNTLQENQITETNTQEINITLENTVDINNLVETMTNK